MTEVTGGKLARGAAWSVGTRVTDRLIGVVSTVVLARLLVPADFGLVAMAMSVIGLIEVASGFGFEVSLVRTAHPSRAQYDTVWTLNVAFGLACSAAAVVAALPTAHFYNDERLVAIMLVLAASWALASLTNIGIVDFQRGLDFKREFRYLMVGRLAGFLVTVAGALLTRSYWALIAGTVTTRVVALGLSYLWHPYRPRLHLGASKEIFSFSVWIFVSRLASFGNTRAADFVLGRLRGPSELGIYRMGEEIGHLPGTELVAPLNRVLLPGVAQTAGTGRSTGALVLAATGVIALFLFPACLGIAAVAGPLVRVMLGVNWVDAIPVVQILSLNAMVLALWGNQHTSLMALGRPDLSAKISILRLAVFAACLFAWAREFGATGVAAAALLASASTLALGLVVSLPKVGVHFADYVRAIWRPLVAAIAMWASVNGLLDRLGAPPEAGSDALRLMTEVFAGIATYSVAISLLFLISGRPAGPERLLVDRVAPVLRKWFGMSS